MLTMEMKATIPRGLCERSRVDARAPRERDIGRIGFPDLVFGTDTAILDLPDRRCHQIVLERSE